MIEHIEIEGFKSLEKVSLDLGALNIFVGTNASGKTPGQGSRHIADTPTSPPSAPH